MSDHNKLVSESNDLRETIASMVCSMKMNHNKNKGAAINLQEQLELVDQISNDSQALGTLDHSLSNWDQKFHQL